MDIHVRLILSFQCIDDWPAGYRHFAQRFMDAGIRADKPDRHGKVQFDHGFFLSTIGIFGQIKIEITILFFIRKIKIKLVAPARKPKCQAADGRIIPPDEKPDFS